MTLASSKTFYDAAPCGLVSTDPNGLIVGANPSFAQWCNRSLDELEGTEFRSLLTVGSAIFHETHFLPLLRMQGRVNEIAVEFRSEEGSAPALINGAIDLDDAGEPVAIHLSVFEATFRRRYEQELLAAKEQAEESEARAQSLAKTLQASLIPPAPPSIKGLDVGGAYRPAGRGDEVGGDFYDIFEVATGEWVIALGDVCGKGAAAAAVTALARHTLRAVATNTSSPAEMLRLLSGALQQQSSDRFCTAVCARLSAGTDGWIVKVALGGHPFPLRLEADATVTSVGIRGDVLGVLDEPEIYDDTVTLQSGESLVFYTDGVTEARTRTTFFGDEGLIEALTKYAGASAPDLAETLASEVVAFQNGLPRDDVAIVAIRAD